MVGLDNLGIAFIELAGDNRVVAVKLFFFTNFGLIEVQHGFCLNDFPVLIEMKSLDIAGRAVGQGPVQTGRRLQILLRFGKGAAAFVAGLVRIVLAEKDHLFLVNPDLFLFAQGIGKGDFFRVDAGFAFAVLSVNPVTVLFQNILLEFLVCAADGLAVNIAVPLRQLAGDIIAAVESLVGYHDQPAKPIIFFEPIQKRVERQFFRLVSRKQVVGQGQALTVNQQTHLDNGVGAMFFAGTSAPQFVFLIDFKIVVGDVIVGIFLISAI